MDKEICGCVQKTLYGLPRACFIATKSVMTSTFYWMRYIIIGISYLWVKKVTKMAFLSRKSGMVSKTSQESLLSNEARNERGFAAVDIS